MNSDSDRKALVAHALAEMEKIVAGLRVAIAMDGSALSTPPTASSRDSVIELRKEMAERDAQWLDLIATLENYKLDTFGLPLTKDTSAQHLDDATDWITCALKNLGLARFVIEQRVKSPSSTVEG